MIGPFEELVLLTLRRAPSYGTALALDLTARLGRPVSKWAALSTLQRLAVRGLVASTRTEPRPVIGGRRRRLFSITPAGEAELLAANRDRRLVGA